MARFCEECGTKSGYFSRSHDHDGATYCSESCKSAVVSRKAHARREAEEARSFDRRWESLVDEPDEMRAMAGLAAMIHGNGHLLD